MDKNLNKVVVLAAGKGKRMNSELPKVLVPLKGRPMIQYLMDSIVESGVTDRPIIVVSPDNEQIIAAALSGYDCEYAIQSEQLGTGNAVSAARPLVPNSTESVLVLYGDHPFIKAETIKKMAEIKPNPLLVLPVKLDNFEDWRQVFNHWGRFTRNKQGEIESIVEFKDASDLEKNITEVNPGVLGFNNAWLWENINKLRNNNQQQEYYLTDLVKIAFSEGLKVASLIIGASESMGINSVEELEIAEKLHFN